MSEYQKKLNEIIIISQFLTFLTTCFQRFVMLGVKQTRDTTCIPHYTITTVILTFVTSNLPVKKFTPVFTDNV